MTGRHRTIAHRAAVAKSVSLLLLTLAAAPVMAADGLDDAALAVPFNVSSASTDQALGCAAQSDGKVLLSGYVTSDDGEVQQIAVARVGLDGALDPSFDGDGRVVIDLSAASILGKQARGRMLAIDKQGRILVGGFMHEGDPGGVFNRDVGIVIRLLANGALDTSWGSGQYAGVSIFDSVVRITAMGYDAAGRLWVAGGSLLDNTGPWRFELLDDVGHSTHVGNIDFTGTGTGAPTAMASEPNGNVLIGGFVYDGVHVAVALARIRGADFAPDPTFGIDNDGLEVLDDPTDSANSWLLRSIAVQRDLRIVLAGEHGLIGEESVVVFGLDANGTDGGSWFQTVAFPFGFTWSTGSLGLNRMVVQSDGKVLVAATAKTESTDNIVDVGVARLSPVGELDTSFGGLGTGKRTFDMPPSHEPDNDDMLTCLTLSAGKPVLVGSGHLHGTDWDFSFRRLTSELIVMEAFESGTTFFWSAQTP